MTIDERLRLPCGICGQPRRTHVGSVHACFGGYGTYWHPGGEPDPRLTKAEGRGEVTQERQDGWYWVRWPERRYPPVRNKPEPWSLAEWCGRERRGYASAHWRADMNLYHSDPAIIGQRIPSPDEPKDPDLLAVARAAKEWRDADQDFMKGDLTDPQKLAVMHEKEEALRSALANLKEGK